jgi:hypothetical protein
MRVMTRSAPTLISTMSHSGLRTIPAFPNSPDTEHNPFLG